MPIKRYMFYWFDPIDSNIIRSAIARSIEPVDREHCGWVATLDRKIVDQCGDTFRLIGRLIVEGKICPK